MVNDGLQSSEQDQAPEPQAEAAAPSPFGHIFIHYRDSLASLREFSSHLNPVATGFDADLEERRRQQLGDVLRGGGDADIKELRRYGEWMRDVLDQIAAPGTEAKFSFEPADEQAGAFIARVLDVAVSAVTSQTHHELLNRSVIMSLVGYLEVLLADLLHAFYSLVPEATTNDDKVLSVNELRSFSSIVEAMGYVVSQKVDDLLRGSIEDWEKFFDKRMNLRLRQLVPDWAQWLEIFQRRHVIVHAGAKATSRYVDRVDWEEVTWPAEKPTPGSDLFLEDAYIERAMDIFEVTGMLLCESVWKKFAPDEAEARLGALLLEAVYPRLLSGHWYVAEHLSEWGERDSDGTEDVSLTFKFNRWLCVKRQNRWEEVRTEVQDFDCSAKDPKFGLALSSLTERPDEFFQKVPAALASGITVSDLKEWPILQEMREDPRFAAVLEHHERRANQQEVQPADGPDAPVT